MKITKGNGVEGIIIYSMGEHYFRVYDHNKEAPFVDYKIFHSDLCVTINDEDAFFYETEGKHYLDHSPATLGITTP